VKLTRIAHGNCLQGDCPGVYVTDDGSIAVQGPTIDRDTPIGEAIVAIPVELFEEAVRALGRK
jgi:hypothetical protein